MGARLASLSGIGGNPASYIVSTPDVPPANPSAYDYEFGGSGTSLPSGWSWVNQSTSTYLEKDGMGYLTVPAAGGTENRILTRSAPPASSWTAEVLMRRVDSLVTNYSTVGLQLRDSSTGKIFQACWGNRGISSMYWTDASNFSSEQTWYPIISGDTVRLRIVKNSSTSVDVQWSTDGNGWLTQFSGLNPSAFLASIDEIGIFGYTANGYPLTVGFGYFRVT